jgi:hypothetical protein
MSITAESTAGPSFHILPNDTPDYTRKRRATTPPSDQVPHGSIRLNWMAPGCQLPETSPTSAIPHRDKRRRPNLANGLRGLSLTPKPDRGSEALPSYTESQETRNEVDEDDMFQSSPHIIDDIQVEELPDKSRRARRLFADASTSDSSDDESRDSEDQFSFTTKRHRNRQYQSQQQSGIVELPSPVKERPDDIDIQDITGSEPRGIKRRDESGSRSRPKRRRDDMDLDMDTDDEDQREHTRWRKNASSYEPEKDRKLTSLPSGSTHTDSCSGIVVTSLSDTESEDSSTEPTSTHKSNKLDQPGEQGFTLSPSLLTHLLNTQRDKFTTMPPQEKGLILYRPLGILPAPQIVQQWPGQDFINQDDSSRFEELDDDENTEMAGQADSGGMEIDMEEPMELD